jgi:virulence-associated protein VagC
MYIPTQQRKAKLFMNNRSQAVRLPKDFQFKTDEVFIRKEGADVVLSPRPSPTSCAVHPTRLSNGSPKSP